MTAAALTVASFVSTTYTSSGTATWPAGVLVTMKGRGNSRYISSFGLTGGSFPSTTITTLQNSGGEGTSLSVPVSFGATPTSVDTGGALIGGSTIDYSWGTGSGSSNNSTTISYNGNSGGGAPSASGSSGTGYTLTTGHDNFLYTYTGVPGSGNGAISASVSYTSPNYSAGSDASLVVNGSTYTMPGESSGGGGATDTTYSYISTGATTSGTITVPSGGSVTVSYYR